MGEFVLRPNPSMQWLELKIPPLLVALVIGLAMLGVIVAGAG